MSPGISWRWFGLTSSLHLDPVAVAVILGMALVTYATKAGGLWLLGRVELSDRVEAGLEVLPGVIVVSILGPELVDAGVAEWGATVVVLVVVWRADNVLLALIGGLAALQLFRTLL